MLEASVTNAIPGKNLSDGAAARLVLECVRRDLAPADGLSRAIGLEADRIDAHGRPHRGFSAEDFAALDWDRVAVIAGHHGVLPLIYRRLQSASGVPAAALERMRATFYGNALSSLHLARELVRLSAMLRAAGVAALTFKGPALALQAWGDPQLRQFNDLDLLVRPADAVRAARVLIAAGYWPRTFDPDAPAAALAQAPGDEFMRPGGEWMIDLHWALMPAYFAGAPAADAVWARAVPITIEGADLMTFGREDLILFLAAHGAKHGWIGIGMIADFGRLIGAWPDAATPALIAAAQHAGGRRMLLLGAALAAAVLDQRFGPAMAAAIRSDPLVARLVAGVERRMFASVAMRAPLYSDWMVPVTAIEGSRARARYLAGRALRPTIDDVDFVALPPGLYPLYYAIRPLRLAWQQGRRMFVNVPHPLKRLRGSPR